MIRITHIEKHEEMKLMKHLERCIKKNFKGYFELKHYGNGDQTSPTYKIVSDNK